MTPTSAPSGLKLTEEQVGSIWHDMATSAGEASWADIQKLVADWRTLRAACDAKDAEIARLKEEKLDVTDLYLAESQLRDRAEARLAAMATVTADDISHVTKVVCGGWFTTRTADVVAALEAFVANKTAGAGQAADPWQPIASAPKDGTRVLCVSLLPRSIIEWNIGYFEQDESQWYSDSCGADISPTYWHPLPTAPSLQRQEAGE